MKKNISILSVLFSVAIAFKNTLLCAHRVRCWGVVGVISTLIHSAFRVHARCPQMTLYIAAWNDFSKGNVHALLWEMARI